MSVLVLDAEALSRLARPGENRDRLRAVLRGAWLEKAEVCVPPAALAELYRGGSHDQVIDSYLGPEPAFSSRPRRGRWLAQSDIFLLRPGAAQLTTWTQPLSPWR